MTNKSWLLLGFILLAMGSTAVATETQSPRLLEQCSRYVRLAGNYWMGLANEWKTEQSQLRDELGRIERHQNNADFLPTPEVYLSTTIARFTLYPTFASISLNQQVRFLLGALVAHDLALKAGLDAKFDALENAMSKRDSAAFLVTTEERRRAANELQSAEQQRAAAYRSYYAAQSAGLASGGVSRHGFAIASSDRTARSASFRYLEANRVAVLWDNRCAQLRGIAQSTTTLSDAEIEIIRNDSALVPRQIFEDVQAYLREHFSELQFSSQLSRTREAQLAHEIERQAGLAARRQAIETRLGQLEGLLAGGPQLER